MIEEFAGIEDLLRHKTTDTPVVCLEPDRVRRAAHGFVSQFPGKVLYAVKANPHQVVVQAVASGGITAFDTASIDEMALVQRLIPNADCSYNHPVKPRRAIKAAYHDWNIRDFVVDHPAELSKLLDEVGPDITVQVRVAVPNRDATISFNSKFGASPEQAVALLQLVAARGATPALSTHIGYQTIDPAAFSRALGVLGEIVAAAVVQPAYLNLGGGFPSILMPDGMELDHFFSAIADAHRSDERIAGTPLRCEPGSAIAHPGATVLARVLLVKDHAVYINDGVYGALAELIQSRTQPPTRVRGEDGSQIQGTPRRYTLFGPTCDSYDALPAPFFLPDSVREGDWLECQMMGAYSHTLITDFNGLGAHEYAVLRPERGGDIQ